MSETKQTRTPYTGSCHCGAIRYILYLWEPHIPSELPPPRGVQRYYRCNCTACHKMGHMHVRPVSPTDDMLLLSPLDPFADLGDYMSGDKILHFLYCKTCAVRCFIFAGDGELVDANLDTIGVSVPGMKGTVKAWRPKLGGGHPEMGHYLSVNAHSIDAGQGFDMRELSEKNAVMYCDCYSPDELESPMRYGKPQEHGSY